MPHLPEKPTPVTPRHPAPWPVRPAGCHVGGFTLIELMVAIAIMAVVAALSWRGIDGMSRAQQQTRERADAVLAAQSGLTQWRADLDALAVGPAIQALDWDGRALRLTRYGPAGDGLRVVGWTFREGPGGGQWLRWQSGDLKTVQAWQDAWSHAGLWAQNPGDAQRRLETAVLPLQSWQLFYYRNNAWSNPLSSDGTPTDGAPPGPAKSPSQPAASTSLIPDGIRLVLTIPEGHLFAGTLTLDWASPVLGGGKS